MAGEPVRSELREAVAIAHFDDGKANALSHAAIQALEAHLDRAEREAGAVLISGRPGMLSGGFDLAVMRSGPEAFSNSRCRSSSRPRATRLRRAPSRCSPQTRASGRKGGSRSV
jgi:enoyl-CoA hydratase/carnithine racemase